MKSERDWVKAALDQWERERSGGKQVRVTSPTFIGALILVAAGVLVGIGLPLQSSHSVAGKDRNETLTRQPVATDDRSLEMAQNRVLGVMRGHSRWSRQRISRLSRDVSRLSVRLARNSEKHIADGS